MPLTLKGSCRCGAVHFEVKSHTPAPYQLCYCSICRKQQGGGGYAINLAADNKTLKITGKSHLGVYRAEIEDDEPRIAKCRPENEISARNAEQHFGSMTRTGPT